MALLITEEDVDKILTFEDSLAAVEEAFRYFGQGHVFTSIKWPLKKV